jgi:hypothetical protein
MTATIVPAAFLQKVLGTIADGEYDCTYEEPSKQRTDKYPRLVRRQSWVVQDTNTGKYMGVELGTWFDKPEQALSCLWFNHLANLVRDLRKHKPGFPPLEQLHLVLLNFYCDPKTFPKGWFVDD